MSRELLMRCLLCLKAGLKRSSLQSIILLTLVLASPLFPAESGECRYHISDEGTLILSYTLKDLSEQKIRRSIGQGHQAEVLLTCRVQINTTGLFSVGGDHHEFDVRRTAFRDQITGHYILLLNGREISIHGTWDSLYRAFSEPLIYSSGISVEDQADLSVKVHPRIIYKKLVPPFSLLYLLPGRHMSNLPWETAVEGRIP